jgi:hypothetical protein
MSLIAMAGGATGTGTVTLLAPVTNTNRTLTLPDATGTVLSTATAGVPVNGPAFSAYQSSAQTALTSTTWTKIVFQTEEFDTNSNFDNVTNYRFTPTVAGYYQFTANVTVGASVTTVAVAFYKNGSAFKYGNQVNSNGALIQGSALIYLNGSTDYVEFYALFVTSQAPAAGEAQTYFQAAMVRSAV